MRNQRQVLEQITEKSMRVLRGLENEDMQGLALAYYNTQLEIIEQVSQAFPGELWSLDTMQGGRAQMLFMQVRDKLAQLQQRMNLETENALFKQMVGSREWAQYMLDQTTPPELKARIAPLPEVMIRAIVNTPFQGAMFSQRYANITDQVASDIQAQLTQSMMNGESMRKAALRVEDVLGASDNADATEGYAYESMRIARTEIMRAQNLGRQSVFEDNNDIMDGEPEWLVTADDKLCKWCLRRDGMTPSEIAKASAAGDPFGKSATMPLHPHCRCTWVPRLKSWKALGIDMPEGEDDEAMGMRNEDGKWVTVKGETFEKWKERRAMELGLAA